MLYISIIVSDQTYCTEYETPVLDEIADVSSATSQDIGVVVKGETIIIHIPKGRNLKTQLVFELLRELNATQGADIQPRPGNQSRDSAKWKSVQRLDQMTDETRFYERKMPILARSTQW